MKISVFSDTHSFHWMLPIDELEASDVVIFAGDCSNNINKYKNAEEVINFANWFDSLKVPHKIWISGNHETSIYANYVRPKEICPSAVYLDNDEVIIEGIKIFGSPYTPTFGNWAFMKDRSKINRVWDLMPTDTDILVTHGPPKGILDLSMDRHGTLNLCGDSALLKQVLKVRPKYHVFGHIHNCPELRNEGTLIRDNITFMNVSCVTDGKFDKGLTSFIKTINYNI